MPTEYSQSPFPYPYYKEGDVIYTIKITPEALKQFLDLINRNNEGVTIEPEFYGNEVTFLWKIQEPTTCIGVGCSCGSSG